MAPRPPKLSVAGLAVVALAAWTMAMDAQAPLSAARIVSLVPAVTETLFAIGAGPQVVAVSSFDDYPPDVASLPRVGALLDPDVERILSLTPQLVVSYGSQTELHTQLARVGVRVYSYRHGGLPAVFTSLTELGDLTGRAVEARRVSERIRRQLAAIRKRVEGRRRPRTLIVFDRDPTTLRGLYASGGRGFLHDVLEAAGGANVFADVDREAVQPSHETLLRRAPEVILELRAPGMLEGRRDAAAERQAWSALSSIPAVRGGRIHALEGDFLVVPGPRVGQATEVIARALHPEAFR